jgi:hypothetical protein
VTVIIAEQGTKEIRLVELDLEPGASLFIGGDGGKVTAGHQWTRLSIVMCKVAIGVTILLLKLPA